MKTKDTLMICTVAELAKVIANLINIKSIRKLTCPNVCFSIIDKACLSDDIVEVYNKAEGWYGIKSIDTGFNSSWLNIICDYYGGGCGCFAQFDLGTAKEEIEKELRVMLINTLSEQESVNKETLLIAELTDKKTFEEFWETGEIISYCSPTGECPICDDILAELNEIPFSELEEGEEMYEHAKQFYEFYLRR